MNSGPVLRRVLNRFGIDVRRVPGGPEAIHAAGYDVIRPNATYSPWRTDARFNDTYDAIRAATLVDRFRCYELWKLVEQVAKLPQGALLEIGVWRGGTGGLIAKQARACGIEDKVYLCDTFTGVVKAGVRDPGYQGGEHADTTRGLVEDLVRVRLGLDNVEILEGIFPDETGSRVGHERFRLCHVDVDVYDSARSAVEWIWGRMVPGGVVVFDDFGFWSTRGITQYVEELGAFRDRLVFHNLNGHAVVVKLGRDG